MKFSSEMVQQFYDEAMAARDEIMERVAFEHDSHLGGDLWLEAVLKIGVIRAEQTTDIMERAVRLQLKADKNRDLVKVHCAAVAVESQKQ